MVNVTDNSSGNNEFQNKKEVECGQMNQLKRQWLKDGVNTQQIVDNMPFRVYWKNNNLCYSGGNKLFLHDCGFTSMEDLIGKDDNSLFWQKEADLLEFEDKMVISIGSPRLNKKYNIELDGEQFIIVSDKFPLFDENDNIKGVLGLYNWEKGNDLKKKNFTAEKRSSIIRKAENIWHQLSDSDYTNSPKKQLQLTDIVDIDILQQLQQSIYELTGVSSQIITSSDEKIVAHSPFFELLSSAPEGKKYYNQIFHQANKSVWKNEIPPASFFKNFHVETIPLKIKNIHLADWIVGQTVKRNLTINEIEQIAKQTGISTEKLKIEAEKLPVISNKKFQQTVALIREIVNQILVFGIQSVQQDQLISERKRIERALRESEIRYRTLVEKNRDGIVICDCYRILFVNKQFCKITGYTKNETYSMTTDDIFLEKDQVLICEIFEKLQAKNHNDFIYDIALKRKTGIKNLQFTFNLIEWNNEKVLMSTITDNSVQQQAEEELKQAKEKAEESDRLKTAFLSNMSHEIRTPMNAIVGFANLLSDPDISMEQRQMYVEYINSSSDTLLKLLDDIIDIARIESNDVTVTKNSCRIDKLISEIYDTIEASGEVISEQVNFRVNPHALQHELSIITDSTRLKQVFIHLLHNALKFTDTGFVEFGYQVKNTEWIEFYVRDTGIGIPPNKLEIIFERFSKIEYNRTKLYGGAGLGLTISKRLVNLLGGEIWVESEQNKGTSVFFTLPFETATATVEEPPFAEEYDWSNKTILIAEDVDINYFYLEEILEETNAKIIWAKDGKQAVELCKRKPIDLVLMDIQMPVMNGYEATRQIKAFRESIPVIAETAYAMSREQAESLVVGCDDYVIKPISRAVLLEKIRHQFDKLENTD